MPDPEKKKPLIDPPPENPPASFMKTEIIKGMDEPPKKDPRTLQKTKD